MNENPLEVQKTESAMQNDKLEQTGPEQHGTESEKGIDTIIASKGEKEKNIADSAHFTNCIGLYNKKHYCTVYDMAIIMKAAMKNELY